MSLRDLQRPTRPSSTDGWDAVPDDDGHDVAEVVDGELPSAETVGAYEQVLPGAADRIIAMLEQQSSHRMEMESRNLERVARTERIQQVLGLVVVLVVFGVGTALILNDHEGPGTLLSAVDLLLLAAVFVRRDPVRQRVPTLPRASARR